MPPSGQNSQKAGHNSLIPLFHDEYSYSGVFGVADYESDICFPKNKMMDTKWRAIDTNFDYESDIGFSNQEIADRKWR